MSEIDNDKLYSVTKAAELLDVPRRRIMYLIHTSQLPAVKVEGGWTWMVKGADLKMFELGK